MALSASVGSASATSYITVAEADRYHEARVGGLAWTAPEDDETEDLKEPALIQATRMLDAMFEWAGRIASDTQALGWPRSGAYDRQGRLVPSTVVPQAIKNATAELALQLIQEHGVDTGIQDQGITSVKAGSVEVKFDAAQATAKPTVPDYVFFLVGPLGSLQSRGAGTVKLQRV